MSEPTQKAEVEFHRGEVHDSELDRRIERANRALECCSLCPRRCGAFRARGERGECQTAAEVLVSSWHLHHGEEPPLSGTRGSGTIFFSGCSMHCVYCQNYTISQLVEGRPVSIKQLVQIMSHLQAAGAHNINFVTPTHFAAQILEACILARRRGVTVPFVYNTGGYDLVETLELFDGIMDIYLADMRYHNAEPAGRYSAAPDYPEVNKRAIAEMHRQVGVLRTDSEGIAFSGVIVRHLVLPEGASGSEGICVFLAREVSPRTYISLMSQYYPTHRAHEFGKLARRITEEEYTRARLAMEEAGLYNGWVQGW
jgi:putative pyruvate formate lyase activating enzyme